CVVGAAAAGGRYSQALQHAVGQHRAPRVGAHVVDVQEERVAHVVLGAVPVRGLVCEQVPGGEVAYENVAVVVGGDRLERRKVRAQDEALARRVQDGGPVVHVRRAVDGRGEADVAARE